jgi:hypothetical protein
VKGLVHAAATLPSRLHVTLVASPPTVKLADTLVALVGELIEASVNAGPLTSIVQLALAVVPLPRASVATTVKVWAPSPRPLAVNGLVHAAATPPSSAQVTLVASPPAVKLADTLVDAVGDAIGLSVKAGPAVSIVQLALALVLLPRLSVATTVKVWAPSPRPLAVNGLVQAAATLPSRLQVTLVASPPTVKLADALVDAVGDAIGSSVRAGPVVSIVQLTEAVVLLPRASAATTVRV